MKWFKHETSANMDAKLQSVLLDYGLEGYGLYWYCLELIAANVTPENITFELEHDCRVIARNTGSSPQRVQEMMTTFIGLGLFEGAENRVFCLKLAQKADDYTAKLVRNSGSQVIDTKGVLETPTKTEKVPLDKNRLDKNRKEKEINTIASFDEFWEAYPRKDDKAKAAKLWARLKPTEQTLEAIKNHISAKLAAGDWDIDQRKYIPLPTTFLNGERWNDEVRGDGYAKQTGRPSTGRPLSAVDAVRQATGADRRTGWGAAEPGCDETIVATYG